MPRRCWISWERFSFPGSESVLMLVQLEPAYVGGKSHASTPDSSFQSGLLRSEGLTVACTTSAASRVMFVAPILPLASNAVSINRWYTLMWLNVGFCGPQSDTATKNGIRTRTSDVLPGIEEPLSPLSVTVTLAKRSSFTTLTVYHNRWD
jgi:hypothetical protein